MDDNSDLSSVMSGSFLSPQGEGSPPPLPQPLSSETGMDDSSGSDGSQPGVDSGAMPAEEGYRHMPYGAPLLVTTADDAGHQGIAAVEFEELSQAVQCLEDLADMETPLSTNHEGILHEETQEFTNTDYILGDVTGLFTSEAEVANSGQFIKDGQHQDFTVDTAFPEDGKGLFKSSQEHSDGSLNFNDVLMSFEEDKDNLYSSNHFADDIMDSLDEESHQDSNTVLSPEFTTEQSTSVTQSPENSNDGCQPNQISQVLPADDKEPLSDTTFSQEGIGDYICDDGIDDDGMQSAESPAEKPRVDSNSCHSDLSYFKISFNAGSEKLGKREVVFTGESDPAAEQDNAHAGEREESSTKKPHGLDQLQNNAESENEPEPENDPDHEEGALDIIDELEDENVDKDGNAYDGDFVGPATDEEDEGAESLTEEIDAMLDEGVSDYKERRKRRRLDMTGDDQRDPDAPEGLIGITNKKMLKAKGRSSLEPLPEGWVEIAHRTGMPLYLHRQSRVVTWARPYFLGVGSARKHKVPLLSIPCLHYKKELQRETARAAAQDGAENGEKPDETIDEAASNNVSESSGPTEEGAVAQAGEEKKDEMKSKIEVCKDESVSPEEFEAYLESLFQFENISIKRFKSWAARRAHNRDMRRKQATERPTFPGSSNVVTLKLPESGPTHKGKKEITLNLHGKTNVCLLHEYAQRVLRAHPKYIFNENDNANAPFQAVIKINDVKYGTGFAANKKLAKEEAAKSTLDILVPELVAKKQEQKSEPNDLEYFDHIPIEDSRFYDLCHKAGQLTPWQILQECLKRNHGMVDTTVNFDVKVGKNQKSEYTMTCGKHVAKGFCKNKIVGKQLAAQTILQKLHPQIRNWGSLIRMYGKGTCGIEKVKEQEEQSVMELQQHAKKNRPNIHILDRLKLEMRKMHSLEQEKKKKSKKFHPGNIEKPATALCPLDV
ncbi:microprocessor complex subunit DGCR8-like [Ptychodera flava]|uniref:microprocessor complex subunit DGCR8-like n=1 Tax=Ptychodera flava TaxID=63121 RepID=UPI003969C9E9